MLAALDALQGRSASHDQPQEVRNPVIVLTVRLQNGTRARMIPDQLPLPPGFVQCNVCGEFNGITDAKNLSAKNYSRTGKVSVQERR